MKGLNLYELGLRTINTKESYRTNLLGIKNLSVRIRNFDLHHFDKTVSKVRYRNYVLDLDQQEKIWTQDVGSTHQNRTVVHKNMLHIL